MEALYAEAVYCTTGEERARTLVESVRAMTAVDETNETNRWLPLATSLCQQAVFELQTRAVEVDGRIEAGDTAARPLYRCSSLETLEVLEAQYAVLNSSEDKWLLFMEAVCEGKSALVDLCILAGVDPTAISNHAIRAASRGGHLSVVERLLQDARVDPSAANNEAFQEASERGHLAIVNRLLQDARVDPSASTNDAICWASRKGHLSVVDRLLQDARVDPSVEDNYAIIWASNEGYFSVVDRLLQDSRADPSARRNNAIQVAGRGGHLSVVERLLQDVRVDPSARDNCAIQWASENGHLPIINRLLQDARVTSTLDNKRLEMYRSQLSQ